MCRRVSQLLDLGKIDMGACARRSDGLGDREGARKPLISRPCGLNGASPCAPAVAAGRSAVIVIALIGARR